MKKSYLFITVFLIPFLFLANNAQASKYFPPDTMWTNGNWYSDTVSVTHDIYIASGVKLNISPGTIVIFQGHYSIFVDGGYIQAQGTINDSIIFEPTNQSTGWSGIIMQNEAANNDSTIFDYCVFKYSKRVPALPNLGGGALSIKYYSKFRLTNCRFSHNECTGTLAYGAALGLSYVEGAGERTQVNNNIFTHNSSSNAHGVLSFYKVALDFNNNIIQYNSGGSGIVGLFYLGGNFNGNFISNNVCYGTGTIYVYANKANHEIEMVNNIVANNTALRGSGFYIYNSKPNLSNNTIVNNLGTGLYNSAGVYFVGNSDADFRSNIIHGNRCIDNTSIQIYLTNPSSDPKFYNNIIEGGLNDFVGLGAGNFYTGVFVNNIDQNPSFTSPTTQVGDSALTTPQNWNLNQGSPAINKGYLSDPISGFPNYDYGGNSRFYNGRIDIGAFESQSELYAQCAINDDVVWDADTIKVNCNILISDSATLSINKGTTVLFQGYYGITVEGSLRAIGSANERIKFMVGDTVGFYDTTSNNGSWAGITLVAISVHNDSTIFKYCNFTNAKAIGYYYHEVCGGAFYFYNCSKVEISNSLLSNNYASQSGGAINIESSDLKFFGNIISNNKAGSYSGGLNIADCTINFNNNVVVNNRASNNGGIGLIRSELNIKNSIFWGNEVWSHNSTISTQIYSYASSYSKIFNSTVQFGDSSIGANVPLTTIQNIYDEDPLFINPSMGSGTMYDGVNANWNIQTYSPLVNKGYIGLAAFSSDFNGNQRLISDTIDVGAYEVQLAKRFIDVNPVSTNACIGSQTSLSAHISVNANYQWQKNGVDIPNAKSPQFSISNVQHNDTAWYNCIFSNVGGSLSSDTVWLQSLVAPSVITHPSTANACVGDSAQFSVNISGSEPLNYQWYNINGALGSGTYDSYIIISASLNDASSYYLKASNTCGTVQTNGANLMVKTMPTLSVINAANTICENASITYTTVGNGTAPISYQWYKNNAQISSASAVSYSITSATIADAAIYYCKASNSCGTAQTNQSILSVNANPVISVQPFSDTLCTSQGYSLNVIANGAAPMSYQWYKSGSAINGANLSTYYFNSVNSSDAAAYYCKVTNSCSSINSNTINLAVNQLVSIGSQSGDSTKCQGDQTSFSVSALGSPPLNYQWYKGSTPISGANLNTYDLTNIGIIDEEFYHVDVSNSCNTVSSTYKFLAVSPEPNIQLGNDTNFCDGGSVILNPGVGYQCIWSNGSYNNQLNVTSSGNYFVGVTDQFGCSGTSDTIIVNVVQPYANQLLCVVGVDTASQKNIVVWEKTPNVGVESFNIYKESSLSNVWTLIGVQDYDSLSVFLDLTSTPFVKPERYAISTIDSCGNESPLSMSHRTMHLTVNAGQAANTWNLLWNAYEGFQPATYRIYRADSTLNYVKIDSIAGSSVFTYLFTDYSAPNGLVYYMVEIGHPSGGCSVSKAKTNFNSSRSNRSNNGIIASSSLSPDFIATPTHGFAPMIVQFYDQTTNGSVDSWYWNFGDGSHSISENPVHQYTSSGVYHVSLSVTNANGTTSKLKADFIDVLPNGTYTFHDNFDVSVYPNPYKGNTSIAYTLSKKTNVSIEIYNSLGELVTIITSETQPPGFYNYSFSAEKFGYSSGVYFLRMRIDEQIVTKRLVEIK